MIYMERDLLELWLPSPVTLGILCLDQAQEPVRILEIGIMQIQHVIKVITAICIYIKHVSALSHHMAFGLALL